MPYKRVWTPGAGGYGYSAPGGAFCPPAPQGMMAPPPGPPGASQGQPPSAGGYAPRPASFGGPPTAPGFGGPPTAPGFGGTPTAPGFGGPPMAPGFGGPPTAPGFAPPPGRQGPPAYAGGGPPIPGSPGGHTPSAFPFYRASQDNRIEGFHPNAVTQLVPRRGTQELSRTASETNLLVCEFSYPCGVKRRKVLAFVSCDNRRVWWAARAVRWHGTPGHGRLQPGCSGEPTKPWRSYQQLKISAYNALNPAHAVRWGRMPRWGALSGRVDLARWARGLKPYPCNPVFLHHFPHAHPDKYIFHFFSKITRAGSTARP